MPTSEKTPDSYFAALPAKQQKLAASLQAALLKINPKYEVSCKWKALAFKRGENYSCMVVPYKDHLKLMIFRGVLLEDPEERLKGSGKNTKHLVLRTEKDINAPYLKTLLKQQFKLYDSGVPWEESCETRKARPMPAAVKKALHEHKLMKAFKGRPPYQQRDYIFWITEAKRPGTQESRLMQMLDELAAGNRYMKMPWGRKK